MQVTFVNQSTVSLPRKFVADWISALSKELLAKSSLAKKSKIKTKELTLVFLDTAPAKKLNREYRHKNYATDILSFGGDGYLEQDQLGELVICPQVIAKQAKEHKHSFKAELGYMLIHGVLHLLGYDHETNEADAKKMYRLQDQIFDRLTKKFDI